MCTLKKEGLWLLQCYVFLYRNKSGIWGWRSEKSEVVSGYEAKVTIETVTKGDNHPENV